MNFAYVLPKFLIGEILPVLSLLIYALPFLLKRKVVHNSVVLVFVMEIGHSIMLFAYLSNRFLSPDYNEQKGIIIIFLLSVIASTFILIVIAFEQILYSRNKEYIICVYHEIIFLRIKKVYIKDITRYHWSDQYFDIYVKDKRIRFHTYFFTGIDDFDVMMKNVN